ncbi:hypothetical protein N0V82_008300 [Gnomoniopsis sp. IMI 355080]|nr:hypothetical protein N0V82_008300 [Gnomoniopsis sp. IMI 355080]
MEEPNHADQLEHTPAEELALPEPSHTSSTEHVENHTEDHTVLDTESAVDAAPVEASETQNDDAASQIEQDTPPEPETEDTTTEEPASAALSSDSLDDWIQDGYSGEQVPEAEEGDDHEASEVDHSTTHEQAEEQQPLDDDEHNTESEQEVAADSSELDYTTDTDTQYNGASSLLDSCDLERSHSLRTEALIQAAARAVLSMRDGPGAGEEYHEDAEESTRSLTPTDDLDRDQTPHADDNDAASSRPDSRASHTLTSPTAQSSVGESAEGSHDGAEDDVFSDRSPRSSVHSSNELYDDDTIEQTTEKGQESPYARSRIASGVSMSDASVVSDLSRLSRYEKEDFIPTSRENRPAFRSPSSVRALQMSSPTPSIITSPTRSAKRQNGFPTISRLGSPTVSGQFSPRGRSTPSRFKKQEAPLVLLHVTLLPLRWSYGEMMNHFEAKKLAPLAFSNEGIKNLRGAWRQLQDRLGDTVLERGILLPHPQNDYEVLEERMLESLELPLRRRARILECGHYLGPSNEMTVGDDVDVESEYNSDAEESDSRVKEDKRHWCKTCKGDIKYEELGGERVFRIKVYASNGLMSAGAWDACWKEMERVDIEVEPIIDSAIQGELAKLSAAFDHERQQQLEAEQMQQAEEEQRFQLEAEKRIALEEERQQLEAQRQEFEEERRRSLEESQRQLEEERRKIEEEQRQRLEEERRQQFEEERQLLDAQRQQFEEQRLELEEQRKLVEEEQRQHVEEARRQELELEQKLIEEQRQELEEARQHFEEERRQRLEEEEELRRLQREEDEQKQVAASRSTSRNSYVEDELASPATERATSTELEPRRRDSDRLREIYGADGRSSDGLPNNSSPAIHIHVDSGRQREEEQNSRQLAIATPRASSPTSGNLQESRHPDSYTSPHSPPPPSQQAYQRPEGQRKSLDSASLPELLGETIRVLFQDPKNVAIAVLVVLIAMLAGQFATRQERGMEIYKPQQHYQHHQLDSREPVGQVIMNTPPAKETVYQTVTAQAVQQQAPPSKEVEIIYQTVTQYPSQETATRVVETVYSTVTASGQAAAPEVASELPPSSADPSVDLPFDSPEDTDSSVTAASPPSFIALGLDPFVCPASAAPEPESDEGILKTANSDEELGGAAQDLDVSMLPDTPVKEDELNTASASSSSFEDHELDTESMASARLTTTTTTTITATNTSRNTRMAKESERVTETVTKTITKIATATDVDLDSEANTSG